jgi:hypothetical protein
MATQDRAREGVQTDTDEWPAVSTHQTAPDRVVFTESENTDGWIATDFAVTVER